ncbi:MAG: phage tail tape measure protein, partial [Cyanobacteria bacterium J06638_38]
MAQSIYKILLKMEGDAAVQEGLDQIAQTAGLTGAALSGFAAVAGKMAADYDFNLKKVESVTTDATGSIDSFDDALLNLSNELEGAIGINEGAAASYDILSAGYKDQAEILSILEASTKTAIGGFSDVGTVSDATTTILNSYGDALGENLSVTERVALVTDQMIAVQNEGKIVVNEYATQIGGVASTASTAGV